jgi:hypothetical protein
MIVLNIKCKKCNKVCNAIYFQQNFENWTSGNNGIDKFIQDAQLMVHEDNEISHSLEWIPYERFYDIEYIEKGWFEKAYFAKWIDGHINKWNYKNQTWNRKGQNMCIILKSLNNSNNIASEFRNEVWLMIYLIKIF